MEINTKTPLSSLSPEDLVILWNDTILSGNTKQLYQIRDAFLEKKIKTIEMQRAGAITKRLKISYDKENNIIHCAGRHFFDMSDDLFQF